MIIPIILASGSETRATLLRNAGIDFVMERAGVDEDMIKASLTSENASPRDMADVLAEMKAKRVSSRNPDALVIGCDQILAFDRVIVSKPQSKENALAQLQLMRGQMHQLLSAAVIYEQCKPVWRHVGVVRLHMHDVSDRYLTDYIDRNWDSLRHAVGGYKLEEEGVRLFNRIDGDYFNVLGLPLLELLSYLSRKGVLSS